jgi:hypothetical protein
MVAFLSMVLPGKSVNAAFPYRFTLSGLGLNPPIVEVWMTTDEDLLRAMQSGLVSELLGQVPAPLDSIYTIDWWWGPCWRSSPPCITDPDSAVGFHTRYYFDSHRQRGYLFYVSKPSYLSVDIPNHWIQMPPEFTQTIQQILFKHTSIF